MSTLGLQYQIVMLGEAEAVSDLLQPSAGDMSWSPMRDEFTSVLVEPPRKEIKRQMQRDFGKLVAAAGTSFRFPLSPSTAAADELSAMPQPFLEADTNSAAERAAGAVTSVSAGSSQIAFEAPDDGWQQAMPQNDTASSQSQFQDPQPTSALKQQAQDANDPAPSASSSQPSPHEMAPAWQAMQEDNAQSSAASSQLPHSQLQPDASVMQENCPASSATSLQASKSASIPNCHHSAVLTSVSKQQASRADNSDHNISATSFSQPCSCSSDAQPDMPASHRDTEHISAFISHSGSLESSYQDSCVPTIGSFADMPTANFAVDLGGLPHTCRETDRETNAVTNWHADVKLTVDRAVFHCHRYVVRPT